MTPLRGLTAFTEAERDVLFGRDDDRDALAKLVVGEGFRAGLLYGELGVGKTSLLRAGLIPHLRDHGVIAVPCDDIAAPAESFAAAVRHTTGLEPTDDEAPIAYLSRVVSRAMPGQLYLFILDEVETVLARGDDEDDERTAELKELFARVVARSGGRARFLFSCASERVHLFSGLERRTGSLFPPTSRYELRAFDGPTAGDVLERTLAMAASTTDPQVAHAIATELAQLGPVLPAELQIAAMGVIELGTTTLDELARVGGARGLERAWIHAVARATGNERAGLRLLAELASDREPLPYSPEWAAQRAAVPPDYAVQALEVMRSKGVVEAVPVAGAKPPPYRLAHAMLGTRIREYAAPARAVAQRAHELLGSKIAGGKRLSWREWLALRREQIEPSSADELAVIARTKRFALIVAGAVAATPLILMIVLYIAMSGRYYLDVERTDGVERVVVRAGRSGLSAFDWLPKSPSFGSIVAETGFSREMIDDAAWDAIAGHDVTGDLEGDGFASAVYARLDPTLRTLLAYAAGDDDALTETLQAAQTPQERLALLAALRPIARDTSAESAFVEQALADSSPAVRAAALAVAVDTARRRDNAYETVLAKALAAPDGDLRRLAFSAVRALGPARSRALFEAALARSADADARAELLAVVTAEDEASAASAVSVLANPDVPPDARAQARDALERAFATNPVEATSAVARLVGDESAPEAHRLLALERVSEHAPNEALAELVPSLRDAFRAKSVAVRTAALPLFARAAPDEAGPEVAALNEGMSTADEATRIAVALAWGELARHGEKAAYAGLAPLVEDDRTAVRAAAARAFGNVGRRAQDTLIKLIKTDRLEVAIGAAHGLANSVAVGAPTNNAVGGVLQLWKRKGRRRQIAVEVYARMARDKPGAVLSYLSTAAREKTDDELRRLAVVGLCNAIAAGNASARRTIWRATDDSATAVRQQLVRCFLQHGDRYPKTAGTIAARMANDPDSGIRADATRILTAAAASGEAGDAPARTLITLADDRDRTVRQLAIRGLAQLGDNAPDTTAETLANGFARTTVAEKLDRLATARAVGAGELATIALTDSAPEVRIAALDTAIATNTDVSAALNAAIADPDAEVRRAALDRIGTGRTGTGDTGAAALQMAVRDDDPVIANLALETLARVGPVEQVATRLETSLRSPSERERTQAAEAARGLAERDPQRTVQLLEQLLDDPSHDVRAAMLPSLGLAYAQSKTPAELADLVRASERHPTRRLVATAGLLLADDAAAAEAALTTIVDRGPPLARRMALLAQKLHGNDADGLGFLTTLVP